jgi:hypothetical protein
MASERANALAAQFEKAVGDLATTIEGCSDAQLKAVGEEGWSVAALAHHVGAQWPLEREYLDAIAAGKPLPAYNWDEINARNAKHAQDFATPSKAEVLAILRNDSPAMASFVRGLSDEQLDRSGALPLANNAQVTTQQLIEGGVLIDHAAGHLKSIRAAI